MILPEEIPDLHAMTDGEAEALCARLRSDLIDSISRTGGHLASNLGTVELTVALFKVMEEFNRHNINIIEIWHQRIFTHLPAKGLITDIECEARDREQLEALVAALRAAGYDVSQVDVN